MNFDWISFLASTLFIIDGIRIRKCLSLVFTELLQMSNILYFWIFIMLHSVIFHFRKTWILCILLKLDASKAQDAKSTDHAKRCWQQHLMSKSDWFVEFSQFVKLRWISRFSWRIFFYSNQALFVNVFSQNKPSS